MTAPVDAIVRAAREFEQAAQRLPALYVLSAELLEVVALIEEAETEEDTEAAEARLDALAGDIRQKAENIVGLSKWYDTLAAGRRAEVARIEEGARLYEKRAERLRSYVLRHLKALGIERIDTSKYSISVRVNPPSVAILEAMMVPSEFQRTTVTVTPDKTAIKKHWQTTGELVAGTDIVRTERLEIR